MVRCLCHACHGSPREAFSTLSRGFGGITGFLDDRQHGTALNPVFYNTYSYSSPSPTLLHAFKRNHYTHRRRVTKPQLCGRRGFQIEFRVASNPSSAPSMTTFPPIRQDTAFFQIYSINQLFSPSLVIPQFTKAFVFPDIQRPSLPTFTGFFRILPSQIFPLRYHRVCAEHPPPPPRFYISFSGFI